MQAIFIRGAPGSGKTTLAESLIEKFNIKNHFEADMYFVEDGVYRFDASKLRFAHEWCKKSFEKALIRDEDVVVSNTFTKAWEIKDYLDLSKKYGAIITIYRMTKDYGNVHGVPQEKVEQMKARMEDIPNEILIK